MAAERIIFPESSALLRTTICPSCEQIIDNPVLLPCLDTYCLSCYQREAREIEGKRTFYCKRCNTESETNLNSTGCLPTAATNFFVGNVKNYQKCFTLEGALCSNCDDMSQGSDQTESTFNPAAEARCLSCHEFLCHACCRAHKRTKLTKEHTLLPLNEVKPFDLYTSLHMPLTCSVHPGERFLSRFCKTCMIPTCLFCITEHSAMQHDLVCLEDAVFSECMFTARQTFAKCQKSVCVLESSIADSESRILNLDDTMNKHKMVIEIAVEKLITSLQQRKRSLFKDLDDIFVTEKNKCNVHIKGVRQLVSNIDRAGEFFSTALDQGNVLEKLSVYKLVHNRVDSLLADVMATSAPTDMDLISVEFADTSSIELLRMAESWGEITTTQPCTKQMPPEQDLSSPVRVTSSEEVRLVTKVKATPPDKLFQSVSTESATDSQPTVPHPDNTTQNPDSETQYYDANCDFLADESKPDTGCGTPREERFAISDDQISCSISSLPIFDLANMFSECTPDKSHGVKLENLCVEDTLEKRKGKNQMKSEEKHKKDDIEETDEEGVAVRCDSSERTSTSSSTGCLRFKESSGDRSADLDNRKKPPEEPRVVESSSTETLDEESDYDDKSDVRKVVDVDDDDDEDTSTFESAKMCASASKKRKRLPEKSSTILKYFSPRKVHKAKEDEIEYIDIDDSDSDVKVISKPIQNPVKLDVNSIRIIGMKGKDKGRFNLPFDACLNNDGDLVVAEATNHRVQVLKLDGTYIRHFGKPGRGNGMLKDPTGVACDHEGNVYVCDSGNHRVAVFSKLGEFLRNIKSNFLFPIGIKLLSENKLIVADKDHHRLQVIVMSDGKEDVMIIGKKGKRPGAFRFPRFIGLNKTSHKMYVSDVKNDRIQVLDAEGKFLFEFGKRGCADGEFINPTGVAVNSRGDVIVADYDNRRLQVFTGDGEFLAKVENPSTGQPKGHFHCPEGVTVDNEDRVYVIDSGNHRIQVIPPFWLS